MFTFYPLFEEPEPSLKEKFVSHMRTHGKKYLIGGAALGAGALGASHLMAAVPKTADALPKAIEHKIKAKSVKPIPQVEKGPTPEEQAAETERLKGVYPRDNIDDVIGVAPGPLPIPQDDPPPVVKSREEEMKYTAMVFSFFWSLL